MKLSKLLIVKTALIFGLCSAAACGSNAAAGNENPQHRVNHQTANNSAANKIVEETAKTSFDSLRSPTETYKTARNACQNRDWQSYRRTLSKDALKFFAVIDEGTEKTLDELIEETCKSLRSASEPRGEAIKGGAAKVEYFDNGKERRIMDFVKEGSDWKITFPGAKHPVDIN